MTYVQAALKIKDNPKMEDSDGKTMPNLIRRKAWEDGQIMVITSNVLHIAKASPIKKSSKHEDPEVMRQVTTLEDLYSNDWEFIEAKKYF